MEKKFTSVLLFLLSINCWSQVGINTPTPKAMLDVNGDLRIRVADKCLDDTCTESVLVRNTEGYVQTISKDQLLSTNNTSFVSGTGNSNLISVNISALTNWGKILFDKKLIDENNDFNITTNTFTAPKDGIYQIYVQAAVSSVLSAGEMGIGIYAKKGTNNPELIAQESYVNVSVLGISVSPVTRKTQTIVSLKAGDQVYFAMKAPILYLELLGGNSTIFTINQIK